MLPPDWETTVQQKGTNLFWKIPEFMWPPHQEIRLPDSNVIFFEMENGKITRRFGIITITGQEFNLKPLSANSVSDWQKGPLYQYLICCKR